MSAGSADHTFQVCLYIAMQLNAFLYGIELVMYIASVRMIMRMRHRAKGISPRGIRVLLVFSTGLLLLITSWVAVQASFGAQVWIAHPAGLEAFASYMSTSPPTWYQIVGSAATIVLNLMSHGLLLFRCYIIWGDVRVIIFPFLLYVSSFPLGVMALYTNAVQMNVQTLNGWGYQYPLAYTSVAISSNLIVSALICFRMLYAAGQIKATLGEEAAHMYTSTAALFVESALAYAVFGVVYAITLGMHSPTTALFATTYVMSTCLSPQMIVLRLLLGRAWTPETAATRVQFTTAFNVDTETSPRMEGIELETGNGHRRITIEFQTGLEDLDRASTCDCRSSVKGKQSSWTQLLYTVLRVRS